MTAPCWPGPVAGDRVPGVVAHPDDASPHARSGRCALTPVILLVDLLRGGQLQGQRVAQPVVAGGQELRRNHHLVGPVRVGPASGDDHRALDRRAVARVHHGEVGAGVRAAVHHVAERDREPGHGGHLGQRLDLVPVEPRLVGQHGHGGGQRLRLQPVHRAVPTASPCRRREHGGGRHRHQQGQHYQRHPAPPRLQAQPGHDDTHAAPHFPQHLSTTPPGSRGTWSR